MCSFFGEVNIPSSRAFWDDCDEEEIESMPAAKNLQLTLEETSQDENILESELFLILEGRNIEDFSEKTVLKNAKKIGTIPTEKTKSALYYNPEKKTLIAVLHEDLTNSGEITGLLLSYAKKAKNVITFSFRKKTEYKSENFQQVKDTITFLRGINSRLTYIKELETPNFISGVSAGIATWRENERLSVSSYVAYTDASGLDSVSTKPILRALHDLGLECATTYEKQYKDESWLYT